ncbi:MAG: DUF3243 family protein [Dehalococcoidia bacterium]
METTRKCIELMDFSKCWPDWRNALKQSIESSRTYYRGETVQVLLPKLNDFLSKKVCASSIDEEVIDAMWDVATSEERQSIARRESEREMERAMKLAKGLKYRD